MKIEPYALDEADEREARRILSFGSNDLKTGDITALRISFDEPMSGWLSLFLVKPDDFGDIYWADFAMLPVSTHDDDGKPLFINCVRMSEVDNDFYVDADGFAKWDGCREIHNQAHVCSDSGLREYMNALAATAMQASRLAGYEGDDKR